MNVLGELNEALITREEVQESVKGMRTGKGAGLAPCMWREWRKGVW